MGEKSYADPKLQEAYECGREDGYREAMEEIEGEMGERHGSRYGSRYGDRGMSAAGYEDRRDMGERRMRDSRGRYM